MGNSNRGIYRDFVKRLLDIVCALLAMIVFSWLYAVLAILVRIKLGKPVIFCTVREGKDEKPFKLYKFRSMTNEKDAAGNLLPDSRRLTAFGRALRSTSLDELPEAWNILKGDMSVIGPRPWPMSYQKYYTEEERKRHKVRPGLSGLAQVNGRTAASWDSRLSYDIEYADNISFGLDIKIVLMTIKKIIKRSDIVATAEEQGNFSDYRKKQWEAGTVTSRNDE